MNILIIRIAFFFILFPGILFGQDDQFNYYLNGDTLINNHPYKKLFKKGKNFLLPKIDVSELTRGIYFLELCSEKNKMYRSFIKSDYN